MGDEKIWYMGERAQSLAIIALTDHPGVTVMPQKEDDLGLSILVALREGDKPVGRLFGVTVRATLSGHLRGPTTIRLAKDSQSNLRDTPFPVCLFLFTVDNGQGYWGWIQQPLFSADQTSTLQWRETIALIALTPEGVSGIVHDVSRWYDDRVTHSASQVVNLEHMTGTLV